MEMSKGYEYLIGRHLANKITFPKNYKICWRRVAYKKKIFQIS